MKLTPEFALQHIDYDHETGLFTWKVGAKAGQLIGSVRPDGYILIMIKRRQELAHRLAWMIVKGTINTPNIDHINGVRGDNRILNLREATVSQNHQNKRKASSNSGVIGVSWCKREGKWRAYIKLDYKMRSLGYYDSPEEARAAYLKAKAEFHPFAMQGESHAS